MGIAVRLEVPASLFFEGIGIDQQSENSHGANFMFDLDAGVLRMALSVDAIPDADLRLKLIKLVLSIVAFF